MSIDESIKVAKTEIASRKVVLNKHLGDIDYIEAEVRRLKVEINVWQAYLRFLQEEAGK